MMMDGSEEEYEFILTVSEPKVTYQSSTKTSHWEHLNLVQVKPDYRLEEEQVQELTHNLTQFFKDQNLPMPIVFFGDQFNLELYMLKKVLKRKDENQLELPL